MLLSPPAPFTKEETEMATKWSLPRFMKHTKDKLDATDAALPTSAEIGATYVNCAYTNVTYAHSA